MPIHRSLAGVSFNTPRSNLGDNSILPYYDGLTDDILGNFDAYLAQAKLAEAQKQTIPLLEQQVADLEQQNAALKAQVAEQDDALIELYEMMGG